MLTDDLLATARRAGDLLRDRGETVAVAEGSAGGLISAALLSVPGASAYYQGGVVVYSAYTLSLHDALPIFDWLFAHLQPAPVEDRKSVV